MMHFGRNQLLPASLGFSPLIENHPRELILTNGNGPPFYFRKTSSYSRLAQPASGLIPVTSSTFTLCPTLQAATDLLLSLRLPGLNQLTSLLRQTPCPIFLNGWHDFVIYLSYQLLTKLSFKVAPFKPCPTISIWIQALFASLPRYFSAFCHHTKFAIGLSLYLELDVNATQIPTPELKNGTQDTWNLPFFLPLLGCNHLRQNIPIHFKSEDEKVPKSYNSTSQTAYRCRFGLLCFLFARCY